MATATATAKVSTSPSDEHPHAGSKAFTVKFKTDGLAEGEFMGYASIFGNKDLVGDVVVEGAFSKSLKEWDSKGIPIPLLWSHMTSDPDFNLGYVEAEEDARGLKVHGFLDMESPKSAQTYRLLKSGRVNQMSISYTIVDGVMAKGAHELRELDLYEVSIVPIGANQETEITAVKSVIRSLAAKAGRTLSSKNESAIRGARDQALAIADALKSVLPDDAAGEQDQEQTSGKEPPADATATKSSHSDPATPSPSVLLALTEIEIVEGEF